MKKPFFHWTVGTVFIIVFVILSSACSSTPDILPDRSIAANAENLLARYEVPAVSWALVSDNKVVEIGASGVTKAGGQARVTQESRFHIGSNTKAMTALLAGISVDLGEIAWESTVGEILTKGGYDVPSSYAAITLRQLLSHTAGVPPLMDQQKWQAHFTSGESGPVQRVKMVTEVFELPLDFAPGTASAYSNMGVVIAGAMLEVVSGISWEMLMQTRLFDPLNMASAGFGPPGIAGTAGEPWGHGTGPVDPASSGADNPAGLGPAGTVHANIKDLAKYLQIWLNEGEPLISRESFKTISTEVRDSHALGWLVIQKGDTKILTHDGSNGMFYSTIRINLNENRGVVVATNAGKARMLVEILANYFLFSYSQ